MSTRSNARRPRRLSVETLEARDNPSYAVPTFTDSGVINGLLTADVNGNGKDDVLAIQGGGLLVYLDNGTQAAGASDSVTSSLAERAEAVLVSRPGV